MNCWCNIVQTLNSNTPQEDHRMPQTSSSEKWNNLDKYNKFINDLLVLVEGGWPPADHIPHDENLLRHTLGLPPRVKQDNEVYPASDIDRNRRVPQPDSDKKTESDKESTSTITTKTKLLSKERQQFSEDRRRRTTVSARSPAQGRQHQFENSQP